MCVLAVKFLRQIDSLKTPPAPAEALKQAACLTVNRHSRQKSFRGKPPKADWEQSAGKVRRRIRSAVMKSNSRKDDVLVRAVAHAFFDSTHGLQSCATGYMLPPVRYSVVAWYVRQEPELAYNDDLDNWDASDDENVAVPEHGKLDSGVMAYPHDDMPWLDLTSLLKDDPGCLRCFKIISPSSNSQVPREAQPYVLADLNALVKGQQRQKIKDLLPRVRCLTVHPEDPLYLTELERLTTI
ncbi:hypothetical protein ABBQ32_010439 [Trebouxia sp. C0010 RCD-2024]